MFESTQPKIPLLAALMVLPLLAGFDIGDPTEASPSTSVGHSLPITETAQPVTQSTFANALSKAYLDLAATQSRDWRAVEHFTRKALASQRQDTPSPEYLDEWQLKSAQGELLSKARFHLIKAIHKALQEEKPYSLTLAAKAQAHFDCWVASAEHAWETPERYACQITFEQSLAQLSAFPSPNQTEPLGQTTAGMSPTMPSP